MLIHLTYYLELSQYKIICISLKNEGTANYFVFTNISAIMKVLPLDMLTNMQECIDRTLIYRLIERYCAFRRLLSFIDSLTVQSLSRPIKIDCENSRLYQQSTI